MKFNFTLFLILTLVSLDSIAQRRDRRSCHDRPGYNMCDNWKVIGGLDSRRGILYVDYERQCRSFDGCEVMISTYTEKKRETLDPSTAYHDAPTYNPSPIDRSHRTQPKPYITCSLDELKIKSQDIDTSISRFFKYTPSSHTRKGGNYYHKKGRNHIDITTKVSRQKRGYAEDEKILLFRFRYTKSKMFKHGTKKTGEYSVTFPVNEVIQAPLTKEIDLKRSDLAFITCQFIDRP